MTTYSPTTECPGRDSNSLTYATRCEGGSQTSVNTGAPGRSSALSCTSRQVPCSSVAATSVQPAWGPGEATFPGRGAGIVRGRGLPLIDRVWLYLTKRPEVECWLWEGDTTRDGYPRIQHKGRTYIATRLVLEQRLGRELVAGEHALHRCDTPRCARPDHLFPGTKADNNLDARNKGRVPYGERAARAKLTDAQAQEIRSRRAAGEVGEVLAREFGVSSRLVYYIGRGEKHRHDFVAGADGRGYLGKALKGQTVARKGGGA